MNTDKILYDFLVNHAEHPVFFDVPKSPPESYVTIERQGGVHKVHVLDDTIYTFECWSDTRAKASNMAFKLDELIRDADIYERRIVLVERLSLYSSPDLKTKKPRYIINFQIIFQNEE